MTNPNLIDLEKQDGLEPEYNNFLYKSQSYEGIDEEEQTRYNANLS
jgi:hypothetical protein